MAGYFPAFATRNVTLQTVATLGATSRPLAIEHFPVSDHRFAPFDGVVMIFVSDVLDFVATTVCFTINPGRAVISVGVEETTPEDDFDTTENV